MVDDGFLSTEARLSARNRRRLARAAALSPAERLDAMWLLIRESWMTLERHPDGMAHFRRRNFRMRSLRREAGGRADGA
jgi:hypothetical protein